MKNKRIFALIFALVLVLCLISGCMPSTNPDSPDSGDSEGTEDNTLVVALDQDVSTFDPCNFTDLVTQNATNALYNKLFKYDQNLTVIPDLAESYENVSDLEWKITLHQGVKFHNGNEMTATDVKATLERTMADTSKGHLVGNIESVEILDPYTISIKTSVPFGALLESLADPCCSILPADLIASGHDFGSEPVGTGAFKFVRWEPANKVVLERFDDYFETDKVANYQYLELRVIPEGSSRTIALETGDVDININQARTDYDRVNSSENLTVFEVPACQLYYLGFNMEDPICQNESFRKAWQYAIDKESALAVALEGHGSLVGNVVPANVTGYFDDDEYSYDPDKARALLEESGFSQTEPITLYCYSEETNKIAQVIQSNLHEVGVELDIVQSTIAVHIDGTANGSFGIFLNSWSTAPNPDRFLRALYHSSSIGANNATRLNVPSVDELIDQASMEVDASARESLYHDVLAEIMDLSPAVPLFSKYNAISYRADLENVTINSISEIYYNLVK